MICSKIPYVSRRAALNDMRKAQRMHTTGSRTPPRRVYHCATCGQWHLTSQARKQR